MTPVLYKQKQSRSRINHFSSGHEITKSLSVGNLPDSIYCFIYTIAVSVLCLSAISAGSCDDMEIPYCLPSVQTRRSIYPISGFKLDTPLTAIWNHATCLSLTVLTTILSRAGSSIWGLLSLDSGSFLPRTGDSWNSWANGITSSTSLLNSCHRSSARRQYLYLPQGTSSRRTRVERLLQESDTSKKTNKHKLLLFLSVYSPHAVLDQLLWPASYLVLRMFKIHQPD